MQFTSITNAAKYVNFLKWLICLTRTAVSERLVFTCKL